MEVASAGLSTYNNSFQQILGLVTAGSEIMVGRSAQVARGLSTIASNTAKSSEALAEYGIAVYDAEGNFRSTYDILKDLSKIWGTMSDAERQALGETLSGGVNQYKVLAAVMKNFQTAIDATATAYESSGSAAEENSRYMESLEARTTALKATFEDFSNNAINSDFVGRLLDVANGFLKLANTDLGQFVTQVGLISGVGLGLSQLVKISNIGSLIEQFSNFGAVLSLVTEGAGSFGAAMSAAGGFSAIALPTIAAVAAAVIGLVELIRTVKTAWEETHPDFETAKQDAANLAEEYQNTKDRLDEINAMDWKDRTAAIEKERQELEKLREEQEKELNVAQMREAQAANRELSGRTGTGTATRIHVMSSTKDVDTSTYTSIEAAVKDLAEKEGLAAGTTEELKEQLKELGYAFLTMREGTKLTADEVNALDADALKSLGDELRNTDELTANQISRYQELHDKLAPVYQQIISLEEAYLRGDAGARQLTSSEKELKLEYGYVVTAMSKFNSEGKKVVDTVKDLNDAAEDVGESVNTYLTDTLFDANGNLTDTAKKALEASDGLRKLALEELQAQQQAATTNYRNLIEQISQIGSQAMLSGQALAQMLAMANIGTGTYQDERDLKRTFAYKFKKSADANPEEYNRWLNTYITSTVSNQYEREMEELSKKMGQIQGIGTTTTDTRGGGSSKTKSAAEEAAKAAKQAWENQKQKELWELEQQEKEIQAKVDSAKAEVDDYKNQLTAISKAQKEQTEAIKKELDAQLKVIKAQKDALEAQQDALNVRADDLDRLIDYNQEYADKQIKNLEAEKDAIQETIDAINEKYDKQIEALETTNKELDKEIEREKLLKALADARAKKTLVFKNGRFTYEQDIEAVSKAQADLDKFDREQQIEKEKELIEENRKNELQYSKDEQAALDAEIERWKKYKDGWANLVSDYNYQQNALLAAQKYGLNLENQTWTQRLNNVNRFAKDYANVVAEQQRVQSQLTALQEEQARLQEIASARQEEVAARMQEQYNRIDALMQQAQTRYNQYQEQLKNIQQNISDTSSKQYTDLPRVLKSVNGKAPSDAQVGDYIVTGGGIFQIIGGYPGAWQRNKITPTKFPDVASAKNWLSSQGYQFQYARGTTSAHSGISLVGEQGPELRVTKSGDGILPAAITQNLWSWGKLDPDKVLGGAMHNLGNLVFNNANLSFPNIRSGSDARLFVENLKNLAYQYAFAR